MRLISIFVSYLVTWYLMHLVGLGSGQIQYDPVTNTLICSKLNGSWCLSDSLAGSTMISCLSSTIAEVRSCNIELSSILPKGYKESAVCYQSDKSGNALCAFNGTGYSIKGSSTPVPETRLCDFVNPISMKRDYQSALKSHVDKSTEVFPEVITRLVARLFLTDAANGDAALEARDPTVQDTVRCFNPWSAQGSVPGHSTSASASAPSMPVPMAFIPTLTSRQSSSGNGVNRFQVNSGNSTDPNEATTSHAPMNIVTKIVTVTPEASTTTIQVTSTYSARPIQTNFCIDNTSVAPHIVIPRLTINAIAWFMAACSLTWIIFVLVINSL